MVKKIKDSLGDRIKGYEKVTDYQLTKRTPVMIRVDGRAFHTFTKDCHKPFDQSLMDAMFIAAYRTAKEMQGFKAAYVQSDEVTFCITDYDSIETQGWFGYDLSKIISITAATMTAHFNSGIYPSKKLATFDARAFNIPHDEVVNAFLWRAKDWERNSLQMYCQSLFSHKQLQGKKKEDMHNMLHDIGKNWTTDLGDREKNGSFIIRQGKLEDQIITTSKVLPTFKDINQYIGHLF